MTSPFPYPGARKVPCSACGQTGQAGPWNPSPTHPRCQFCGGKKYVLVTIPEEVKRP